MILSFRKEAFRHFAEQRSASTLRVRNPARIRRILAWLDAARVLPDTNVPGFRSYALKGRDKGRSAVDISERWLISFSWRDGNAHDVDLERRDL